MRISILQIVLLCMGKPTSATWDQRLAVSLEAVENTPPLVVGEVDNITQGWIQASEEYLIKPMIQKGASIVRAKRKCKEANRAAMLFNPDSDYRGIELLKDAIAIGSPSFHGITSWLIDRSSNVDNQCTFVKYNHQSKTLSTMTAYCSPRLVKTTIMCIMKSHPTPKLA